MLRLQYPKNSFPLLFMFILIVLNIRLSSHGVLLAWRVDHVFFISICGKIASSA